MENINDFLNSGLKNTLQGIENLHAVFLSYRGFAEHIPGEIKSGKSNLSIEVIGTFNPPDMTEWFTLHAGLTLNDMDLANAGSAALKSDARAHLKNAVETPMQIKSGRLLFVTYAGLMAYKETIKHCEEVRRKFPNALIIVVTCDCELESKKVFMKPFLKKGVLNEVVVTRECGGVNCMSEFIEKLIEVF